MLPTFSTTWEIICFVFILWIASAGFRLLGQAATQFFIVLHLYNLLWSSVKAWSLSWVKPSRLPTKFNPSSVLNKYQNEVSLFVSIFTCKLKPITCQRSIEKHEAKAPGQETPRGSTSKMGRKCYSKHKVCTRITHLTSSFLLVIACILSLLRAVFWSSAMAQLTFFITNEKTYL